MTTKPALPLLLLIGIAALAPAHNALSQVADDALTEEPVRRYSVELIVFTYDSSVSSGTEVFVADKPEADPTQESPRYYGDVPDSDVSEVDRDRAFGDRLDASGELAATGADKLEPDDDTLNLLLRTSSLNLRILNRDELTLVAEHDKLQRLDAYQPVLWTGWEQDVREEADTAAVDLRRLGSLPLSMSGTMKLYLGRFLHLVADVKMEAPGSRAASAPRAYRARPARAFDRSFDYSADSPPDTRPVYYRIQDDRIMKSGDLRYYDHPKFGILAKLTRQEDAPLATPPDDTGALQPAVPQRMDNSGSGPR